MYKSIKHLVPKILHPELKYILNFMKLDMALENEKTENDIDLDEIVHDPNLTKQQLDQDIDDYFDMRKTVYRVSQINLHN